MVKVPGQTPKGKQCRGVVNLIDMYPTLIELCRLPENPVLDGRSFAPLLRNPDMEWNHPTLTNGCFPGFYRVYDGRYSYISYRQRGAEELYDHNKDPMEWINLASDPDYAQIRARLKAVVPKSEEPRSPENTGQ
jgi:arylsulfatase A-like enzyme